MAEPFDAFEYLEYLQRNWRVPVFACIVALVITLTVSLLQPKRYTAVATVAIDPPGFSDPRMATAVSPMYLESLKTYEKFSSSDSLFLRAASKFGLQKDDGARSIESLKKSVLKVTKLRDTKILEIRATLSEPRLAQSFVQYVAEQTVVLSANQNAAADHDLMEGARRQLQDARTRLERARKTWSDAGISGEALATLQSRNDANLELLAKLQQLLAESRADLAGYKQRERSPKTTGDKDAIALAEFAQEQAQSTKARVDDLQQQINDLQSEIARSGTRLATADANREELDSDLKSAQTAYESAVARVGDLQAAAGMRGDRLRIIDPGIVPQRPSSPNTPLNAFVGLCIALIGSMVYLGVAFAYRQRNPLRSRVAISRVS